MTNNIYPPDHLLRKWEELIIDEEENLDVVLYEAFQAGADQELEACCALLLEQGAWPWPEEVARIRAARRPKPPSLRTALQRLVEEVLDANQYKPPGVLRAVEDARRALKSLPD